jgi:hypothetical protein
MVIKYTSIYHSKALQNVPKLGFFGLKTNPLATLYLSRAFSILYVFSIETSELPRTSMLAQVLQIIFGERTPCKKLADLHPSQGNLLQRNNF